MRLKFFLVLIASTLSSLALAGPVETNVRICGISSPYQRMGEQALGIFGSSSTGIKDQFFRVKGHLGIEEDLRNRSLSRADAIADFLTAVSFRGIRICVRANMETIERGGSTYYFASAKAFELLEQDPVPLRPSELSGLYQAPIAAAGGLTLASFSDAETGRRFYFQGLAEFLKSMLGAPCHGIDRALEQPQLLSFTLSYKATNLLATDVVLECGALNHGDLTTIHIEFLRQQNGAIHSIITVDRQATATNFSLTFLR